MNHPNQQNPQFQPQHGGPQFPPPAFTPPAKPKSKKWPIVVTGIAALFLGYNIGAVGDAETATADPQPTATVTTTATVPVEKTTEEPKTEEKPKKKEEPKKEKKADAPTTAQEQALRSAESYLNFTAFSKLGLKDQLLYEEHSEADAKWAVNAIDADWMEQAEKSAISYLEYAAFSEQELVGQLEFEKFTTEQAAHGASVAFEDR